MTTAGLFRIRFAIFLAPLLLTTQPPAHGQGVNTSLIAVANVTKLVPAGSVDTSTVIPVDAGGGGGGSHYLDIYTSSQAAITLLAPGGVSITPQTATAAGLSWTTTTAPATPVSVGFALDLPGIHNRIQFPVTQSATILTVQIDASASSVAFWL